jgi:hypothetical protein
VPDRQTRCGEVANRIPNGRGSGVVGSHSPYGDCPRGGAPRQDFPTARHKTARSGLGEPPRKEQNHAREGGMGALVLSAPLRLRRTLCLPLVGRVAMEVGAAFKHISLDRGRPSHRRAQRKPSCRNGGTIGAADRTGPQTWGRSKKVTLREVLLVHWVVGPQMARMGPPENLRPCPSGTNR